ncbi:TolC family protein [Chitinophaga qingshengii]|uniref:TolC family protein n=1 Tax=Chitinophaga qingshengii TaxID=1569794 RepID=A0ABR7TWR9_9BACT|nr:TolC family protein [Chitinophaga qingshengii]MBC9934926.1 TolC family protein [Chitinophaga qingshengii]
MYRLPRRLLLCLVCLLTAGPPELFSQIPLKALLQQATQNYPLLKSRAWETKAAQKGITASKSTLIPSLDAAYQVNYATYNNITGMSYPQLLMPISGPPSAANHYDGVFGSATSLLLNWQPVTFGQRGSQVDLSRAGAQFAHADAGNEIFQHQVKVINAYLDIIMAKELEKVFLENVARTEANLSVAKTLVVNGIKPGVDTALLKAEMSRAKVELLNSRKYREQTIITLSALLATDQPPAVSDTSYFSRVPTAYLAADTARNPLLSLYASNIALSKARRKVLGKTTMPTLGVWGTAYARGSGIDYNGNVKSTEGLAFQRYNYGAGLQLSIPILQFARIKSQVQQQDFLIRSNEEKMNEITLQVRKQSELADTTLSTALMVSKESPLFYESAAFSYKAMQSRYQSGLANFSDLMQAQYALVKAATDNKTAYMAVWKALLYKAAVNGDLNLFLNQVN